MLNHPVMYRLIDFKNRPGFSLIEVMVATAILAVGLVAVISIFPLALRANKSAEQASLASAYARAKMEEVIIATYDEVLTGTIEPRAKVSTNPSDSAYILERSTVVKYIDADLNDSASDTGLKQITVTVYWTSRFGTEKSLILNSIISRK